MVEYWENLKRHTSPHFCCWKCLLAVCPPLLEDAAVDPFWACMPEMKVVPMLCFGLLTRLAKMFLLFSIQDPEMLFRIIQKIETELLRSLDPSIVYNYCSAKLQEHLISENLFKGQFILSLVHNLVLHFGIFGPIFKKKLSFKNLLPAGV